MEYIYGRKPVLEALKGRRRVFKVRLAEGAKQPRVVGEIVALAKAGNVEIALVGRREIDILGGGGAVHQGVIAEVSSYPYVDIADLIEATASKTEALIVALDGVTDPQNFGAIIRTVTGAGGDGLIVPRRGTSPITAAVVKASAGVVEYARIVETNLSSAIDKLKTAGFWVVGADGRAPTSIWEIDLSGKVLLVFGSEGAGFSRLVKSKCDFLVKLPLAEPVESLNVSAAAAVMTYEVVRRRS